MLKSDCREIIVCIYDTFDINLGIKNNFMKYMRGSCG